MATTEVTKVVLGELTIPISTATPLAALLAKELDHNKDGIVSVDDISDAEVKTRYRRATGANKLKYLTEEVADIFVEAGVFTEEQKMTFIGLPLLYSQVKRFNAIGTSLLNDSKSCGFFEELFYKCRSFEPKVWKSIVSEISDKSSPLYMDENGRVGQSFLVSLFNTIQGLVNEPPQKDISFGQRCFEYSALSYNREAIDPALRPVVSDFSKLYSHIALALVEDIEHTNRITLKCEGDCNPFSRKSIDLVYPFKLTAAKKTDVTTKDCHSNW